MLEIAAVLFVPGRTDDIVEGEGLGPRNSTMKTYTKNRILLLQWFLPKVLTILTEIGLGKQGLT